MLHPIISDERLNLARHEIGHAFLAYALGFEVHGVELDAREGRTTVSYPMAPEAFSARYEQSPLMAALMVVRIVSCIRAGSYVEIWGGRFGGEPTGRDLERIQVWREAVLPTYGADGWVRLYAESYRGLQVWYRHESVRQVFRELGPWVAPQSSISRYQLLSALEVAGAGACPSPAFAPVLPPATARRPAPQQSFGASVRRRAELQAVPPRSPQLDEPLMEDGQYRYYSVDERGRFTLFRRESKATGTSNYLMTQRLGEDRNGKPLVKGRQFVNEGEARKEMVRLAG
jgi:hypothetical protein